MAHTESRSPAEEGGHNYREASADELEKRDWTKEALKQAVEKLTALAEAGVARMRVPTASEISPSGVTTDSERLASLIVALPDRTRRSLAAGAAALTMGGIGAGILIDAPQAGAAEEPPAIHEIVMEKGEKTYVIPQGAEEFEVRLDGKNTDIGEKVRGYRREQRGNRTIYHVEDLNKLNTLTLTITPEASKSVDVGIHTSSSTERDLQLFKDTSGEMKFLTGTGKSEQEGLASYALVESVLGGKEKTLAGIIEATYMPLNVRILNNYPQSDTAGIGVSTGYVYVDKDTKLSTEVGGTYDPKLKKMLEGREGLVALSYAQKDGRFGINAELLSTVGSKGKGAAEVTLDYATIPDRGEGQELTLGVGFGIRGAHIDTSPSKEGQHLPTEMRYATIPVSWRTPYGEVTAGPEIDVDTGDVRVAGGMKVDTGRILEKGALAMKFAGDKWKEFSDWAADMMKEKKKPEEKK